MSRHLLLVPILLLAACVERPAWVLATPEPGPGRRVQIETGSAAEVGRLGERACERLAAPLAAPPAGAPVAPAHDDRMARLAGALPTEPRIPEPPVPVRSDTWFEGENAWVMATVTVGPWFDALAARAAELDRTAAAAVQALPDQADAVDAVRCLRVAAPAWAERELVRQRLERADAGRSLPAATVDQAASERRLRDLINGATVELVSIDAGDRQLLSAVGDTLAKRGWRVVAKDGWARMAVGVAVSKRTVDGLLRLDGVLDGELTVSGESAAPVQVVDRGDGGDELLARVRLGQRLGLGLADELDRRLIRAATR